jgi:hypothetical protein
MVKHEDIKQQYKHTKQQRNIPNNVLFGVSFDLRPCYGSGG